MQRTVELISGGTGEESPYLVDTLLPKEYEVPGVTLRFEGKGNKEVGVIDRVEGREMQLSPGGIVVRVNPGDFCPTEVQTLLCNLSRAAHARLESKPSTSFH